ncbi:hypothetical protein GALMADRAFT_888753 [Galerina marginata CBS 339.88]|uniref:Uncharacterized protein n=1 Tax=Galerina marginata (strain CBS 339.88) TaxID=685588 RepID=A0A067SGT5_GALM3|nr:hypothetical protein GALMADRAFT_888753 [Galerina marginata CBS 339.88]
MILLETLTGPQLKPNASQKEQMFYTLHKAIPQAGPFEDLIALMNIPEIKFPANVTRCSIVRWEGIVRVFGKYLERVCGSVPPGFRITIEENYWRRQESYYYDADCGPDQVSDYSDSDDE